MILRVTDLKKNYQSGGDTVSAVRGVSFSIEQGAFVSLMGPSGSGKSTLLNLLGGLDQPTSGSILLNGLELTTLSDSDFTRLRRQKIGFIFQFFNLVQSMNAMENVELPLLLDQKKRKESRERAILCLERVGLKERLKNRPSQLSGGEMQRVAIARVLAMDPDLILADEPTGNLDSKNTSMILELLQSLAMEEKKTLLMVTHSDEASRYTKRILRFRDGNIQSDESIS
jgi:putative ABC transport system ATP-binding protein